MFMKFLLEFNSFFKEGDTVLIKYWYNGMVTPVKILKSKEEHFKISHNIQESKIQNAPDELIEKKRVIGLYRV